MKYRRSIAWLLMAWYSLPIQAQSAVHSVRDYGASGDGRTLDTEAIQKAIDACGALGGGTVFFDAGTYLTGTIELCSDLVLQIGAGAVVKGSGDIENYREHADANPKSLIWGDRLENVTIEGPGTIDGHGEAFHDLSQPRQLSDYIHYFDTAKTRQGSRYGQGVPDVDGTMRMKVEQRPFHTISLGGCCNVRLRSFTIMTAPFWAVELNGCDDVFVSDIRIRNNQRMVNSDGINLKSCRNVIINGCDIISGDDAIAITSSTRRDPDWHPAYPGTCTDIAISNCILNTNSRGVLIAAHGYDVARIRIESIIFRRCNRGVYISSTTGNVRDILVSGAIIHTHKPTGSWWGTGEPVFMKSLLGHVTENIVFSNVVCRAEGGMILWAEKKGLIRDVTFRDFDMQLIRGENIMAYGGNFDFRGGARGIFKHDIPGIYAHFVDGLALDNFRLERAPDLPDFYREAFEFVEVDQLKMCGVESVGYQE